ncbi:MAG: superoxide dismutase [Ignavibacteria bacterium]|nr:superoxide dismutase [Ignavibacteria bacterium]MCU7504964.1 superoxide dismutase [Ignavibacteria bacterium]MCU7514902.1 superoxide dismutase [Ignavibacteria bacterium]
MKILALEAESPGIEKGRFKPFLKEEALKIWELYQNGTLRELYFSAEADSAILILECSSIQEAESVLSVLPLVRENLISFQLIALKPYPGFKRLFEEEAFKA